MPPKRSHRNLPWFAALVGAILAVSITGGSAQSGLALTSLTAPDTNLAEDCRLKPYIPPSTQVVRAGTTTLISPRAGNSQPFPGNPWSGTDPKLEATVRGAIDPASVKPWPDVPGPGFSRPAVPPKPADNILEAYHAAYAWLDAYGVHVHAVTFNDVTLAPAPESLSAVLSSPGQFSRRLVRGATAIRVSASSDNVCFKSILAYVESLK